MGSNLCRLEVSFHNDARAEIAKKSIERAGFGKISNVFLNDVYTISSDFSQEKLQKCADLLHNPVTQQFSIGKPLAPEEFDWAIEIGFLPGVTDNVGNTAKEGCEDSLKRKYEEQIVASSQVMFLSGKINEGQATEIAESLSNKLIERTHIKN